MSKLVTTSKRFLEWAQSLPHVVIPAGLESDMQEAIAEAEAAEHSVQRTVSTPPLTQTARWLRPQRKGLVNERL